VSEKRLLVTIKSPNVILRIKVGDSVCDKCYSTGDKFLISADNEISALQRLKKLQQLAYRAALPSDAIYHLVILSDEV